MKLAVFGSMNEATITAVYGSLVANQEVDLITAALEPGTLDLDFPGKGRALVNVKAFGEETDADIFLIMALRGDTYKIVADHKSLFSGKHLVLAPGGVGITERIAEGFDSDGLARPHLAQVPGFPAIGQVEGRQVILRGVKQNLPIGALDGAHIAELHRIYSGFFPGLVPTNVVSASLSNTNNVLHPSISLLNASRIENKEKFVFYRTPFTEGAGRLIDALDLDRLSVARALGAETKPLYDILMGFYAHEGMTGATSRECLMTWPMLESSTGPTSFEHRYFVEDVGAGLAPMEALGEMLGITTPAISSVVSAISTIMGEDMRRDAKEHAEAVLRLRSR